MIGDSQRGVGARIFAVVYACVALPALIALCFLTGPFQAPDEPSHFFRAIQLSHGQFRPVRAPDRKAAGGFIEQPAKRLVDELGSDTIDLDPAYRYRPDDVLRTASGERSGPLAFTDFSNTAIYFPAAHAVPALAIAAARYAGAPPLVWLYAGRLANALAAIAISAAAIMLFEESAIFAFALCMLPMVLFETATLSPDALVIAFSVLLASLTARIARGGELLWWHYIALSISLFYVGIAKFAYIPLAALPPAVALIQKRRAQTTAVLSALSLLTIVLWLLWTWSVRNDIFNIRPSVSNVDAHLQLQYLWHHPWVFFRALAASLRRHSVAMVAEIGGAKLGWLNRPLPVVAAAAALAVLLATSLFHRPAPPLRSGTRLVTAVVLLLAFIAVYLLLYLQFNPVGHTTIEGAQGRYFIPLLAFLPLVLPGWPPRGNWGRTLELLTVLLCAAESVVTVVFVWSSYWRV